MQWYLATEDIISNALAKKILSTIHQDVEFVSDLGLKGNTKLKQNMKKYCDLARQYPVLLLTDLDHLPCAPALKNNWCQELEIPKNFIFRIVVREAEAWLMAHREAFSHFSGVSKGKIPLKIEDLKSPKEQMLSLIKNHGNRAAKEILPRKGSTAKVSLTYNNTLVHFVEEFWNPNQAAIYSPSLKKTIDRLSNVIIRKSQAV
jgi:hypothetical protein